MLINNLSDIRALKNFAVSMAACYPPKVLSILVELMNRAVSNPKEEYEVSFEKDETGWFIVFPEWPGKREALAMVCGADKMLDAVGHGNNHVSIIIRPSEEPITDELLTEGWIELSLQRSSIDGGGTYLTRGIPDFVVKFPWSDEVKPRTVWLCPVTLFIFGGYPKYFYGKVL